MGKGQGDDFRDGKVTLPVILAYARGSADDRAFWKAAMQGERIEESDLAHAIRLIRDTGAPVRYARARASLRPAGDRRAGAIPRQPRQVGACRGGRIRGRPRLLIRRITSESPVRKGKRACGWR